MTALLNSVGDVRAARRSAMKRAARPLAAVIAAICLIAPLSACGSSASTPQASSASSSQTAKKPVTKAPSLKKAHERTKAVPKKSTADNAAGSAAQSTKQRSQMCATDELSAKLTAGQGAGAGSMYPYLVLTNTGTRTCLERGYPGVSFRASGKQIGAPANRDESVSPVSIWLKPGESAHSQLRIVNVQAFDSSACRAKPADALLVFPPDQTASLSIDAKGYTGCENVQDSILTVRPLEPGE